MSLPGFLVGLVFVGFEIGGDGAFDDGLRGVVAEIVLANEEGEFLD